MEAVKLQALQPETVEIPLQPASYDIWDKKYRLKTKSGEPLDQTIQDTYTRVARASRTSRPRPRNASSGSKNSSGRSATAPFPRAA